MLFNLDWLKDYVEIDISAEELARILTMIGHEVEELREENGTFILDVNITPNRSDCLSYIGLAREISAALKKPLVIPNTGYSTIEEKCKDHLKVEIEIPDKVHRFAVKVFKNMKIGESPEWMKKRLESVGLRSVCNLVDITNYVQLEAGHPTHAYDINFLSGRKIGARLAIQGEKMTTLDGTERNLLKDDIVIIDAQKIVALGGIMGGANSEISNQTTEVALEAAWFDPIQIRKTSKRLALSTDASYRMERTADINGPLFALDRCCALIQEIMKADILSDTIDEYPKKHQEKIITFRPERAKKLTAIDYTDENLIDIFERLEFNVQSSYQYRWKIQIPSYRSDIEKEVDLIEEAARIFGYDKIPTTLPPCREGAEAPNPNQKLERSMSEYLVSFGFNQVLNYSFNDLWENELFGEDDNKSVKILNPIADDMGYLRSSIVPKLLKAAIMNNNYGIQDIRIYELGSVFNYRGSSKEITERRKLGIVMSGKDYPLHWNRKASDITFFHLKGIVESLPMINRMNDVRFAFESLPYTDGEQTASIYIKDIKIGYLGKISSKVADIYDFKSSIYISEIDFDTLVSLGQPVFKYSSISKYQSVERDIALIMDENISISDLLSCIKNLKLNVLRKATLFDVYHGGRVPEGKKSVALNLYFLNDKGSFTNEEIGELEEKILKALENRFSAVRISK